MIEFADNIGDMKRIRWKKKKLARMLFLENNMTKDVQMQLTKLHMWNESYKFLEKQVSKPSSEYTKVLSAKARSPCADSVKT